MEATGWCALSAWTWERIAPVAKFKASHSRQKQLDWDGKVRTGAEVTALFKVLKASCLARPQTHHWVLWVRA